jgi:hypothetical protein
MRFFASLRMTCLGRLSNYLGVRIIPERQYELMGFGGKLSLVAVVRLEMIFCSRTFRGQFLLVDQPWGILGRNVLNAAPLLFDGPRLIWNEYRTGQPVAGAVK